QPPLEEPPELPEPVLAVEPAPAAEPLPAPPAPSPTEVAATGSMPASANEPGSTQEPDPFSTTFRPATVSQAAVEQTEPSSGAEPASRTTTELPPAMSPEKENFLTLGGLFYQRIDVLGSRLGATTSARPSLPALVNLYMDAKPSDSLRGFVVGRLVYDPLNAAGAGPQAVLDQLWFRFDIASRVFITAGRQQSKWGSSLIWNPTDFLQAPNQQPLEGIDLRLGVDMLKVNIPWEAMASNLTLLVTADLNGPGEDKLRYGAAGRADIALGNFGELGLIASFLQNRRPRYGLDWSMGLGPLDLNAELSLVRDSDVRLWQRNDGGFSERKLDGPALLASAGVATQFRLADVFRVCVRVEGFYNPLGYTELAFLTWLQSTGDYRPLFFGRYYGMGQVSISRRSMYAPTLSFTGLANISDRSVSGRVDFSMAPTTAVRVFAFVEAPFGERGGEFRFQPDLSVAELPVEGLGLLRAGINVRMRI
ncbi:MAG TPA: hypothetical protein VEZ71_10715, partial [Archangium sp.]|nr:hypothetical protein [Archangium sp.]